MRINQSLSRFAFAALALVSVLTACPAPVAPTLASIVIAGAPSDNNLKMNAPVTLTATAKDSSGASISGATFTWVSSNPDVVSVDAGGVVTAKKFGKATITASAGGVSAATLEQTTYGLEAVFGTVVDGNKAVVETSLLYRFRPKNAAVPANTTINYSISGPSGWNGNALLTDTDTFPATNTVYRFFGLFAAAVSGNYKMTLTYNAEKFESQSRTVDANSKVPLGNITISSATTGAVSADWTAITGAQTYYLSAVNTTDGSSFKDSSYSPNLNAMITGLTLDATKKPVVILRALSFALAFTPTEIYPNQFNYSRTYKDITIPTP